MWRSGTEGGETRGTRRTGSSRGFGKSSSSLGRSANLLEVRSGKGVERRPREERGEEEEEKEGVEEEEEEEKKEEEEEELEKQEEEKERGVEEEVVRVEVVPEGAGWGVVGVVDVMGWRVVEALKRGRMMPGLRPLRSSSTTLWIPGGRAGGEGGGGGGGGPGEGRRAETTWYEEGSLSKKRTRSRTPSMEKTPPRRRWTQRERPPT